MKKTLLLSFILLYVTLSFSQNTSSSDAAKIKNLKTIVALQEYPKKADKSDKMMVDSLNAALKFAINNYWTFNKVSKYMPISEAKTFVKKNKDYCYITIDVGVTRRKAYNNTVLFVSSSEKLSVYAPKQLASVYLPAYRGTMTQTSSVYATMQLNRCLDLLYDGKFKNLMGSIKYVKNNGPKIIKKTLLIPKEYISPKISKDDIKLAYPYDLDFCDLDKVETAILNKDAKYAVLFHVPIPVGGKMIQRMYVSNAEDGDIYGVADGNKVELFLGTLGSIGGGSHKKYLINNKELKQLGKMVE